MGKLRFKQKPYIILMVMVGLFIAGIYILAYGHDIMSSPLWQVIYSILITIMIWTGCVWIVRFLWRKYPWEHQPVRHLILEIIMILSYTLVVGLIFFSIDILNENVYDRGMVLMGVFNTLLITFLVTHDDLHDPVEFSLDHLETLLDQVVFFRVSRQFIANIQAIRNISILSKSSIWITTKPPVAEEVMLSSSRTHSFRKWLDR